MDSTIPVPGLTVMIIGSPDRTFARSWGVRFFVASSISMTRWGERTGVPGKYSESEGTGSADAGARNNVKAVSDAPTKIMERFSCFFILAPNN